MVALDPPPCATTIAGLPVAISGTKDWAVDHSIIGMLLVLDVVEKYSKEGATWRQVSLPCSRVLYGPPLVVNRAPQPRRRNNHQSPQFSVSQLHLVVSSTGLS